MARDPHRYVNDLDDAAIERLIARLEGRAKNEVFTRLFDKYAERMKLPSGARVLEIGCGTGAVMRALARRADFDGRALGVDHSPAFVAAARRFAAAEGLEGRVEFAVGDAHDASAAEGEFDAVIAHTVISHVADPLAVLAQMARRTRRGGTVVIFDGDYASMTYAHPDHALGRRMDDALVTASFNNPRIMRDLPRRLPEVGLRLATAWGDAVTEIGSGSYFRSFIETYAPYVAAAGLMPAQAVDDWLQGQRAAMEAGTFFAACTYYTFLAVRS